MQRGFKFLLRVCALAAFCFAISSRPILSAGLQLSCAARLDHSFVPSDEIRVLLFVNSRVFLETSTDDRVLVGGRIHNGMGVVRLHRNGEHDPSFVPLEFPDLLGIPSQIHAIAQQSTRKILIAGWVKDFEVSLLRVLTNGVPDESFFSNF